MKTIQQLATEIARIKSDIANAMQSKKISIPTKFADYGDSLRRMTDFDFDGNLDSVEIPPSITSLRNKILGGNEKVNTITIPLTVTSISSGAFTESAIEEIIFSDRTRQQVKDMSGFNFGLNKTVVIHCSDGDMYGTGEYVTPVDPTGEIIVDGTKVIFTAGLGGVPNERFKNDKQVFSIENQSNSINSVGKDSFNGCSMLIDFENTASGEQSNQHDVGEGAFSGCSLMESYGIPNIRTIGKNGFSGCRSLKKLDTSICTSIGESALSGCSSLETLDISNASSLGNNSLSRCTSLTNVKFKGDIASIPSGLLDGCTSFKLGEHHIGNDPDSNIAVESIGNFAIRNVAFDNVSSIKSNKINFSGICSESRRIESGSMTPSTEYQQRIEVQLSYPSSSKTVGNVTFEDAINLESKEFRTSFSYAGSSQLGRVSGSGVIRISANNTLESLINGVETEVNIFEVATYPYVSYSVKVYFNWNFTPKSNELRFPNVKSVSSGGLGYVASKNVIFDNVSKISNSAFYAKMNASASNTDSGSGYSYDSICLIDSVTINSLPSTLEQGCFSGIKTVRLTRYKLAQAKQLANYPWGMTTGSQIVCSDGTITL